MADMVFICSQCGGDIRIDETLAGSPLECPKCNKTVLAPLPGIKADIKIGDFKLIRCIGTGGMGEVWLAYQDTMDRHVALKILYPAITDNEKFVSRFMQEVKISAKLHHPNIVTSYYAGVDKGIYYLAISFVDGMGLNEKLEDEGLIPEKEALRICLKIAIALKYAWNKFKMVHRDIKPGNIMISKEDKEVHLMDMGISKNLTEDNTLTMTGMIVGTPYYMSPEQARGDDDLDCRADIYALGSTLYHMLTGDVPYDAPNTIGILTKLISDPLPPPQEKNPCITDESVKLLEAMMTKDAQDRQQTWENVIKDIQKVQQGKPPITETTSNQQLEPLKKTPTKTGRQVKLQTKSSAKSPRTTKQTKAGKTPDNKNTVSPCPSCGVSNKVDALFCVRCGKSLSRKCPECSEKVSINMNFCSKCGTDIKTIMQLEVMLEKVKNEQHECHWDKIIKLSDSLPEKSRLTGKKSPKLFTQIFRIKTEAERLLHFEDAYKTASQLAKKYAEEDKNVEAFNILQDFLSEYPKNDFAPEIKHRINQLKQISYQGPEQGKEWVIPNSKVTLVPIKEGEFSMGSTAGNFLGFGAEKGRKSNEGPQHNVTISQPFWMGKYLITIGDFLYFLNSPENHRDLQWTPNSCSMEQAGKDKKTGKGCWGNMQQPMVEINWMDASNFCKWLTRHEIKFNRLPEGYLYRLPTEAEWEYCCRAGTTTTFHFGESENKLSEYAWIKNNSNNQTHPVGEKKPNQWGLCDMHGNVWEWCQDKYGDYMPEPAINPYGSSSSIGYVRRGGSWINNKEHCRSAYRNFWEAKCAFNYLGFRLVLAPAKIRMRGL
jgi:formylglycine-generating enzyme required for sulfatase activity/DNA-directed RNA polymerase subunit RPC12/RpoP